MDKQELKIFHIAGITDLYKTDLINKLKKLNLYVIFDLDEETEKIYKIKEIQNKIKELEKVKLVKKKKMEGEISLSWKDKLEEYIKKVIENNKSAHAIIFIGNTLNIKHIKNKVIIPANNKFFLKVNLKENAQEIIKFNLKKYHDDNVNGVFPLDYINLEYLINSRELLQKGYQKLNYNIITLDKIEHYFEHGIYNKKPDILYVVLNEEYTKEITSKKKVYGFNEDWIALSSIATGIDRGYQDGIAFIKERIKGSFKKLHQNAYIYVVPSTNFLSIDNNSKFYQEPNRKIKIIKSLKVEDVLNKLKELKIKFI